MYAIGMCVDEAYLVPALVALTSVAESSPSSDIARVPIRVLTSDLPAARARSMGDVVRRLGFASLDVRWERLGAHCTIMAGDYISATTYLRFNFLDEFVKRPFLAYLDADLLVVGDVSAPFGCLGSERVGLVRDAFNHTIGRGPALPGVGARWPLLKGLPYFNAGAIWCPTGIMASIRSEVDRIMRKERQHIHFNDQDALNLWAARAGMVVPIDLSYNTFELDRFREIGDWIYRLTYPPARGVTPAIVHFVGPDKPWHDSCPATEAVGLYRKYLRATMRQIRRVRDQNMSLHPANLVTLPTPKRIT